MPSPKEPSKRKSSKAKKAYRTPALRGKVWVEIGGKPAMTEAGADLLEQMVACGSLSEAARRLRFAYRRAWLLVDGMNALWPQPLVTKATGGKDGGGTRVTPYGQQILAAYREAQIRVEHALGEDSEPFRH
jgi:molybdate transport system regulatory protein